MGMPTKPSDSKTGKPRYTGRRIYCRKCGCNKTLMPGGDREYCELCLNDFASWGDKDD